MYLQSLWCLLHKLAFLPAPREDNLSVGIEQGRCATAKTCPYGIAVHTVAPVLVERLHLHALRWHVKTVAEVNDSIVCVLYPDIISEQFLS